MILHNISAPEADISGEQKPLGVLPSKQDLK